MVSTVDSSRLTPPVPALAVTVATSVSSAFDVPSPSAPMAPCAVRRSSLAYTLTAVSFAVSRILPPVLTTLTEPHGVVTWL